MGNNEQKIIGVIGFNGKSARVTLKSGKRIAIRTTTRPKIGDRIVEGKLSRELSVRHV